MQQVKHWIALLAVLIAVRGIDSDTAVDAEDVAVIPTVTYCATMCQCLVVVC